MTNNQISLSVVIPTCDREESLREALECVLAQSTLPDEVVIVNNGRHKLDLGALPGFVRVIDIMPYAGASQARNFGVLMAQGDYVAFLDDDDSWEENYVHKVRTLIVEGQQPDCIVTRLDQSVHGEIQPHKDAGKHKDLLNELLSRNPGVTGSNTIVKKDTFMAIGGYDPALPVSEDVSLVLEFILREYSVLTASHIQAIVVQHQRDRLTSAEPMFVGISRHLQKYGHLMSFEQRTFKRQKICHYRYLAFHRKTDFLGYLVYRLIRSSVQLWRHISSRALC